MFGLLAGGLFVTATVGWRPVIGPRARPLASRTFARTPERLSRGRYLVQSVDACLACHSPRDWTQHDAPIVAGYEAAGQDLAAWTDLPGHISAPNLTPDVDTGAGSWSDDALARAIREGIGHDGRALFPLMPFDEFRHMSDEDVASVVVYLRSLPPVRNALAPSRVDFPIKYLIRAQPRPILQAVREPDRSSAIARGEYLTRIGICQHCHTPRDRGQARNDLPFAGGFTVQGPWGRVASANLTPDPSGIPYYDETLFLDVIRTGRVKARTLNQVMPWHVFRHMSDTDLKDIFAYLRTLGPVRHHVDNALPPTYCAICKGAHGAGDQNRAL
jgi:mono/diheme cytochrome c family protein